jgi:hypothetical protein
MDPSSSSMAAAPLCEFREDSDSSSLRLGGPRDIETGGARRRRRRREREEGA